MRFAVFIDSEIMQDTICMYTEYFSELKVNHCRERACEFVQSTPYLRPVSSPSISLWVNGISIKQTILHVKLRSFLA